MPKKEQPAIPEQDRPVIVGRLREGVFAYDANGKALKLAIVDDEGHIVDQGEDVSRAAYKAALNAYWQYLKDIGVMRTHAAPPPAPRP